MAPDFNHQIQILYGINYKENIHETERNPQSTTWAVHRIFNISGQLVVTHFLNWCSLYFGYLLFII